MQPNNLRIEDFWKALRSRNLTLDVRTGGRIPGIVLEDRPQVLAMLPVPLAAQSETLKIFSAEPTKWHFLVSEGYPGGFRDAIRISLISPGNFVDVLRSVERKTNCQLHTNN
jgi:hypothetical protein